MILSGNLWDQFWSLIYLFFPSDRQSLVYPGQETIDGNCFVNGQILTTLVIFVIMTNILKLFQVDEIIIYFVGPLFIIDWYSFCLC